MSMWQRTSSPFGEVAGEAFNYLEQSFNNSLSTVSGEFASMLNSARESVVNHKAYRTAVAAGRRLRYGGTTNEVRELFSVGEMQNAPQIMQGVLAAMPEYRELYNNHQAAGFENGFSQHDHFRGSAFMLTDHNYRMVTNGLSTDYDDERIWNFTTPVEFDGDYNKADQIDILKVWKRSRKMDWEDEDPFSEMNAACSI